MSFKKATAKDEKELAEFQAAKVEQTGIKTDGAGLKKALESEGISFGVFSRADEQYRKRALKEKYADLKLKYGWLYDQPISDV